MSGKQLGSAALTLSAQNLEVTTKRDQEWWRGAVIYQIYPRSFADSNGDGIGDLPGIIRHLDHVASLGVDAIWLSPFFKSPMDDFGYDVSDYYQIDPMFGTLADFDTLVARAHQLGMKVIIDQVYSHTSDQHPWFIESRKDKTNPKHDWFVWVDPKPDGSPPNNWQSVFGGPAWQWDNTRCQYYMHNFLTSQPQLNVHNPDVQDALLEVAKFWLDRDVDGFRLDAINFGAYDLLLRDNPPAKNFKRKPTRPFDFQDHIYNMSQPEIIPFLERIRALLDKYQGRFTVAEVGGEHALREMKLFTEGDARLNSAYSFEYLYADKINGAYVESTSADWPGDQGEGWPSWAFSNHDAPRAVSRWGNEADPDKHARLFTMLLLSLRGNAFVYQGEELGLVQGEVPFEKLQDPEAIANWPATLGRDGARTPMPWNDAKPHAGFSTAEPWLPIDPRHPPKSVAVQENDPSSMLHFMRRMIALRKSAAPLQHGTIEFIHSSAELLIFTREAEGEVILCAFNLSAKEQDVSKLVQGKWRVLLTSTATKTDAGSQQDLPSSIAPVTGIIATR